MRACTHTQSFHILPSRPHSFSCILLFIGVWTGEGKGESRVRVRVTLTVRIYVVAEVAHLVGCILEY